MFCKYKHIFGKDKEGFHSWRFANVAVLDVLGTLGLAFVLSKVFKVYYWCSLLGLFVLAIVLHRLFCVNTTINMLVFGKV
jgi:hypothetical protein